MGQANNNLTIVGRVGKVEEAKYFNNSNNITLSLAVNRGTKDKEGNYITDWFKCVFWGKQADYVGEHISKGSMVSVAGSMVCDSYPKQDGSKAYDWKVNASSVNIISKPQDSEAIKSEPITYKSATQKPHDFADIIDDIPPF